MICFLITDSGKQLLMEIGSTFCSKNPVLTISPSALVGAIVAPSYWWLMGKLMPLAKEKNASSAKSNEAKSWNDIRFGRHLGTILLPRK